MNNHLSPASVWSVGKKCKRLWSNARSFTGVRIAAILNTSRENAWRMNQPVATANHSPGPVRTPAPSRILRSKERWRLKKRLSLEIDSPRVTSALKEVGTNTRRATTWKSIIRELYLFPVATRTVPGNSQIGNSGEKMALQVTEMDDPIRISFVCPRGVLFQAGKVNFRASGDYLEIHAEPGKFDSCAEEDEKCPDSCFSVRFKIEPERRRDPPK